MSDKISLFGKIQKISNDIRNIEKNMTVGQGNNAYKAVSDIDVVLEVKKAETKNRVVSIPIKQELVKTDIVKTIIDNSGREAIKYVDVVKMTLRIIDLDDTTQYIDVESFGRGVDSADKGFGKASTYARKYALLNAYKIATGTDPDADKSKESYSKENNEIKEAIMNYMMQNFDYARNVQNYYGVTEFSELTDKQLVNIYHNLQKKNLL